MKALILALILPTYASALTLDEDAAANLLAKEKGAGGEVLVVCSKQSDPSARIQVNKKYLDRAPVVLHPVQGGSEPQAIVIECAE